MSKTRTRKSGAVALTSLLLVGTGVAVAYWSTPGGGAGTVTTADPTEAVTVVQTSTVRDLAPGVAAQPLSGTFDNTDEAGATVHVSTVTAAIGPVTPADGARGGCDASDYRVNDATMPVDADLAAGTSVGSWSGASIEFVNKAAVNQDGCKGATVTITYTVN